MSPRVATRGGWVAGSFTGRFCGEVPPRVATRGGWAEVWGPGACRSCQADPSTKPTREKVAGWGLVLVAGKTRFCVEFERQAPGPHIPSSPPLVATRGGQRGNMDTFVLFEWYWDAIRPLQE